MRNRILPRVLRVLGAGVVCWLVAGNPLCKAQLMTTGAINGTIVDQSGAAVPEAKVTITNVGTRTATQTISNAVGSFSVAGLPVGNYEVTVTQAGFSSFTETMISVSPASVRTANVMLKPGAVVTTVNVEASAAQVQTSTSDISSQVEEQQVGTLPLNGRSYQGLAALMPGVVDLAAGSSLGSGGFNTFNTMSINGKGQGGTLYTVDGIWNMNTGWMRQTTITPNPDAIQEVRVLQNNYSPEYNLMGANVVIVQTKSGTQTFRGDAWEYLRNTALNARNFFSPTHTVLQWNIFGWDLGGPFYIPNHFNTNKQKVFFYFNQQWVRKNAASTLTGLTPTQDMRNGLFTTKITNPLTGQPFPQLASGQYQIPASMIDQNALVFLNALAPLPNFSSGNLNYVNLKPGTVRQRDDEVKVDYNISSKLRLMGEYFDERVAENNPAFTRFGSPFETNYDVFPADNQLAQIQLTQTISPSMINQTSIAMNNYVITHDLGGIHLISQVPNFHQTLPFHGFLPDYLPFAQFSGGWSKMGASSCCILPRPTDLEDTLSDNWSWMRGKHYLQAGGVVLLGTKRQYAGSGPSNMGAFNFSGQFTGHPIADFLLGDANTFGQSSGQVRKYIHYPIVSPYFEDQWKATRRLTISAGTRLLFMPWSHQQLGFEVAFDPAQFNPANVPIVSTTGIITPTPNYNPTNGIIFNGAKGVPPNLSSAHEYYLAPYFGFAWDVFGDGRTSLRSGYSINYTRSATSSDCAQACTNFPLINSVNLINVNFTNPTGGQAAPLTVISLTTEDFKNLQAAQVQTYSLSLQHQFGTNWFVSIAGVGDIVRHGMLQLNINQPLPSGGLDFNPLINTGNVSSAFYAPFQGWSSIGQDTSSGVAYWNALEINLRHPVGHNLFLTAAYTWSHNLTDVQNGQLGIASGDNIQNPYAPLQAYGNSPLNVPQVFSASLIYSLPRFQATTGWKRAVLGGWKYSDITTIQSGSSLTPGLSIAKQGLASRPNATGPLSYTKTVNQWFSTGSFSAPAAGFYGNAGTGTIRGPGLMVFNMALYKDFHITERQRFQFRSEFFNVFNHTNFRGVSTSLGSNTFGQLTSAADPRILEFALRYQF